MHSIRAQLSAEQVKEFLGLCADKGIEPSLWGFEEAREPFGASIQPAIFGGQLALTSVEALDRLTWALSDDIGAPEIEEPTPKQDPREERLEWLSGL